jgi:saccharopine dehydrogenase-like NADP-dependent oxidoreductase
MRLQDRVAQAALRRRCHYVDLAGLALVKEQMLPHAQEIADLGLSFVVSAGWLPGLTELLPLYAPARARDKMDSIESLSSTFVTRVSGPRRPFRT